MLILQKKFNNDFDKFLSGIAMRLQDDLNRIYLKIEFECYVYEIRLKFCLLSHTDYNIGQTKYSDRKQINLRFR